ncbi:head-tail adaptor protein [Bosea caraganae]|uniref:Head-tail adaptor protein n=1 Tax=Bosea caraganae TaxID=2763117 RepID=A0A370L3K3_9HYPH|nr:phage head closure protein [Bosea caraganae]RDJ22996.1 head-tail adaptor protein [Bosea caraganae]RDJ28776.1 head-tail adaptor protein [Bosea caraganae]
MAAASERGSVGALRRRLILEAPVATPDGLGGATQVYATVAALWAQVEWMSGDERWRAGRPEQFATHRVTLRWRAGLDAGQRLRDGARIYEIRAVDDPDGSRRRLICLVEEARP